MTVVQELANEIISSDGFKEDYARLEQDNILTSLSLSPVDKATISSAAIARLLQSAMIFSQCDNDLFHEVAQKISTASLDLAGGDENVIELFSMIQSRLMNFAAIAPLRRGELRLNYAPLSMHYEFFATRDQQTIQIGESFPYVLSSFQLNGWNILRRNRAIALSAPTSAGKSFLLILYIVDQLRLSREKTIAYVVPTRALINQVTDNVLTYLARHEIEGVNVTNIPVDLKTPKTLYVVTQERLVALLIGNPDVILDLVVVDEAQMISERTRGVLLESVVDRITARSSNTQFVFSGPMLSNPEYFGKLFGLKEFSPCSTRQSPVSQNLVFLNYSDKPTPNVSISQNTYDSASLANVKLPSNLRTAIDKLSYLSFFFGSKGSSIVYAGGKAEAETVATKIAQEIDSISISDDLAELIEFVRRHVHEDYALVNTLKKGVGFHYGHMPALLRKELEEFFRAKKISFIVCTSTLLYGINLPAKNIFLFKPTTGRGIGISGHDFWNLAGRAGRLGQEVEGNIFIIDYPEWETKPISQSKDVSVVSALQTTLQDRPQELVEFLDERDVASQESPELEIVLGKLVLDKRNNTLQETIHRYRQETNTELLNTIEGQISAISDSIDLPSEVLDKNIGVSVFRQVDLFKYMVTRLKELKPTDLIPEHPLSDFSVALNNHRRVFRRIHTYLLRYAGKDKRHNFFAPLALRWMRGDALPVLIKSAIDFHNRTKTGRSVARIIRDTMENVEDDLRFRYVRLFTCYNSLLEVALKATGNESYVFSIPNIPLFLEMGGSSSAMINLMALGLSRTSSEALVVYITDKDISPEGVRAWLKKTDFTKLDLSPVCLREIQELAGKLN